MKKWKKLYGLSGTFECPYCYKVLPISEASRDHKEPKARSNNNNSKNIIICCKKCNNRKSMLTPEEYKLWKILDDVRNGDKDPEKIKQVEYIMYLLEKQNYRGIHR